MKRKAKVSRRRSPSRVRIRLLEAYPEKYYRRLLKEGANVAVLDTEIAKAFPDSTAVNDALPLFLKSPVLLDVRPLI